MRSLLRLIKRLGKGLLCVVLERQTQKLRRKHTITVVTVSGSVGKTSTKAAIATTLGATKRVAWQKGNYNDRLTVPMVFFDATEPGLFNVPAWIKLLWRNQRLIARSYPYDVVVLELGPDGPGQMDAFAYLRPDIAVLTAVAPEHMEFFGTLDAVANEELLALKWAKRSVVNIDDVAAKYLQGTAFVAYGVSDDAAYRVPQRDAVGLNGQEMTVSLPKQEPLTVRVPLLGVPGAKAVAAAVAVADLLGVPRADIKKGLERIAPFPGRMQLLAGVQDTLLIDDTYNASPIAVKATLDVLYAQAAPERIAILGSMNELGDYSAEAHREVGEYCDPRKLGLVVTIGRDAEEILAPAAAKRGCVVQSFASPYAAGAFVAANLKPGAVILAKGSQSGIFAEEALKSLLANPSDASKLVRQSAYWMSCKAKQFGRNPGEA